MSITSDFHMHTSYSGDSDTPMEDMIKSAIAKGLKEICITEHHDIDFIYEEGEPDDYFLVNTDAYLYDLLKMRQKYEGQIEIGFGVELGMQPNLGRKLAAYSHQYEFDFIIASNHLAGGKDPYLKSYWEGISEEEGYHLYFQDIAKCIRSFGNFDVYGHLDYVLRYGPTQNKNFHIEDYASDIDAILNALIDNEKGIELNTAGWKYGLGAPHPCPEIIKRYKALGGEIITIGSDAHDPARIGADFDKAEEVLKACGFTHYTIFHSRIPEFKKLS